MNSGIFVVWTVSGFYILKFFLKYFPNLNPKKYRGSRQQFSEPQLNFKYKLCVNKDNFETLVSIQYMAGWTDFVNEFVYTWHHFIK